MGKSNFEADVRFRQKKKLSSKIKGKMAEKECSQAELGEKLGISQVAVSKKLQKGIFDSAELFIVFRFFDFTPQEICEVMKEV